MRVRGIILLLALCCAGGAMAQQVSVTATMDSVAILIGEQMGMTVTVVAPEHAVVELPTYKERAILTPGVEIVHVLPDDTVRGNDSKTISRRILLTSFDEDAYKIPEQTVRVAGKEYHTKPLALKVLTVDVDTVNIDQFFPPKDVQDNPFDWAEWKPLLWMSLVMFLLIVIAIYLYVRYKQGKPIISRWLIIRHIPAHQKAYNAIAKIKEEQLQTSSDQKVYYTRLTEALRQYIEERFGFSAMEMTTTEIIAHLSSTGDALMVDELRTLFEMADLVKFAKHLPLLNENDRNLVNAVEFINLTKTEEQEREERIAPTLSSSDKRVKESRRIAKILLYVIASAVVLILAAIIWYYVTEIA